MSTWKQLAWGGCLRDCLVDHDSFSGWNSLRVHTPNRASKQPASPMHRSCLHTNRHGRAEDNEENGRRHPRGHAPAQRAQGRLQVIRISTHATMCSTPSIRVRVIVWRPPSLLQRELDAAVDSGVRADTEVLKRLRSRWAWVRFSVRHL